MSNGMTMPGDRIAAAEEYIPGPGTYEKSGVIYAAIIGKVRFNDRDKIVNVAEVKHGRVLKPGDTVLGEVGSVTNSLATVAIGGADEGGRIIGTAETGVIHVSKITEAYTDDARKEYRPGDLVRARILQASPSLQLTTKEPELGVLKAACGRCRLTLVNNAGRLYCDSCERFEHRKLANDFGRFTPGPRESDNPAK